ncbi:MAG: ergothioneine biosynthesis protein EgtB [Gemmatimonadetes bacterium]|nr:ergothioneine biosynthesis protein EgtB [Gemmatimonadota bacterium]NNF12906.1 ergothioneine biosynthesis protein EgtB [Gemmatimonadota bacterium]NNL30535.1 ergothioneine biosynthesis protein EgtB [Gemmatimonadota bacterium]
MDLHVGRALSEGEIALLLTEARERTLLLTAGLTEADLRRQHDPLMSPIVWDLGHIAHFEDVWLRQNVRGGGTGSEGLSGIYDPFENPRAVRDSLPLPSLRECRTFLAEVRRRVLDGLSDLPLGGSNGAVSGASTRRLLDEGFVFRMVLQHEYQHNETILQTLQLKQGDPYPAPRSMSAPSASTDAPSTDAMVRFPGGPVRIGTDDLSTTYDNERPVHEVELNPFAIDVHPVTNGAYLDFIEDGGYDDPAHWAQEGWAWRREEAVDAPKYWVRAENGWSERFMDRLGALDPSRPVCHVCYWEADAYARWAGKRLPTEFEWEAAASWDPASNRRSPYPWGDEEPSPLQANLDALVFETTPVGAYPSGASALGCWDMLGNVWEWTSSDFHAYPGYQMFPYPEYSEAFYGPDFKVLRGGSWATRFGAVRNTFRNWDYPVRRQIFSGLRCARDD